MRRTNTETLGSVIKKLIEAYGLKPKIQEREIIHIWFNKFEKGITSLTKKIAFNKGTLYIYLSSSVLRQELFMQRKNIIKKLNEELGEDIIKTIEIK